MHLSFNWNLQDKLKHQIIRKHKFLLKNIEDLTQKFNLKNPKKCNNKPKPKEKPKNLEKAT